MFRDTGETRWLEKRRLIRPWSRECTHQSLRRQCGSAARHEHPADACSLVMLHQSGKPVRHGIGYWRSQSYIDRLTRGETGHVTYASDRTVARRRGATEMVSWRDRAVKSRGSKRSTIPVIGAASIRQYVSQYAGYGNTG